MRLICVIGLGYIGLPLAAVLAGRGFAVRGCDTDPAVVAAVAAGRAHFFEAELDGLLSAGGIVAGPTPAEADVFVVAVPTPLGPDQRADLHHVEAAIAALAPWLRPGNLVILESTCPVGTTERLAARLAELRPDLAFPRFGAAAPEGCVHLAHCPERVLPGAVLRELVGNDRIIGGLTPACAEAARALYAGFVTGHCHLTDCRTAEFAKLSENAFRDVNIAFANELADLARAVGVDPFAAMALANRHPRVAILRPGPGVGGHCIAVDPWFLAEAAPAPLIRAARAVNDARPSEVVAEIRALAAGRPATVACLGISYKPDVTDLRGSPALAIARGLAGTAGLTVTVCDPVVPVLPADLSPATLEQALAADILALLVPHRVFRELDRAVFRGRRMVDPTGMLA